MTDIIAGIFTATFFAMYFLPAGVAVYRHHRATPAIVVLSLLTGWTIIGWILSLAWALTGDVREPSRV